MIIDDEDVFRLDLVNGVFNSPEVIRAGLDAYARKKAKEQVLKAAKIFSPLEVLRAGGATTPEQRFSIGDRPRTTFSLQYLMTSVTWQGARQRRWLEMLSKLSAPFQIFEKLRCTSVLEICKRIRKSFVLVPKGKPCPAENFSMPKHEVDGKDAPPGRRPVVAAQHSVEEPGLPNIDKTIAATRTEVQRSGKKSRRSKTQEAQFDTTQLDTTVTPNDTDDGKEVEVTQNAAKGSVDMSHSTSQNKTFVTPNVETLLDDVLPSDSRSRNRESWRKLGRKRRRQTDMWPSTALKFGRKHP